MQECINCLYKANHPFGITFDNEGLCSGCQNHLEKESLDWSKIFVNFKKNILKNYKNKLGYDCIIPVRGTPEYFFVVDVVKNRIGLNPLLVSYNHQFNSTAGIKNLDLIRDNFDCDIYIHTKNPITYKKLVRETFFSNLNINWPFLAGETSFCVNLANEKDIPLIIWPYNQQVEQVGSHSYLDKVEMSNRSRHEYDLAGINPEELIKTSNLINRNDIEDLIYPTFEVLQKKKIIGIYLSNFLKWDTRKCSEYSVKNFNAQCVENFRTFDTYDRIDHLAYMSIHDILKFKKFGYSRVTDSLCKEIRFKRIDKKNAKEIESYYQSEEPIEAIKIFFTWLGANYKTWDWFKYYYKISFKKPKKLNKIQHSFVKSFKKNHKSLSCDKEFILIGKGLEV